MKCSDCGKIFILVDKFIFHLQYLQYEEVFDFSKHNVEKLKGNVFFVPWYEQNGIKFQLNDVVQGGIGIDNDIPEFSEIRLIMIEVTSEICCFACKNLNAVKYNPHYKASNVNYS